VKVAETAITVAASATLITDNFVKLLWLIVQRNAQRQSSPLIFALLFSAKYYKKKSA
jgi:hypothetical protein